MYEDRLVSPSNFVRVGSSPPTTNYYEEVIVSKADLCTAIETQGVISNYYALVFDLAQFNHLQGTKTWQNRKQLFPACEISAKEDSKNVARIRMFLGSADANKLRECVRRIILEAEGAVKPYEVRPVVPMRTLMFEEDCCVWLYDGEKMDEELLNEYTQRLNDICAHFEIDVFTCDMSLPHMNMFMAPFTSHPHSFTNKSELRMVTVNGDEWEIVGCNVQVSPRTMETLFEVLYKGLSKSQSK